MYEVQKYVESISDAWKHTDYNVLRKQTSLWLDKVNIHDLWPIFGSESIKDLCLWDCHLTDMYPLVFCKNLSVLGIFGNKIRSVCPIIHIPSLTQLSIRDNPLQPYNWLYFLCASKLDTLWIYSTPLMDSFEGYSKLLKVLKN